MKLSSVLKTNLRKILKATNQRIVQLDKDFGQNSATSKNATSFLEKGAISKYKGISSSGHTKIDIPKLIRDIENDNLTESEANAILVPATGQRLKDGDLMDVGPGITTKTREIRKFEEDYDIRGLSKKQLIEEINERNEIAQDFQTAYDDLKSSTTLAERQDMMPELFGKRRNKMTYSEIQKETEKLEQASGNNINNQLKNGI